MENLLHENEPDDQQFIADYENCAKEYKSFADRPFIIPQLSYETIDKIMEGGNIGNTSDCYVSDYYLKGILHLYKPHSVRAIHGMKINHVMDMHVLGRTIQMIYN